MDLDQLTMTLRHKAFENAIPLEVCTHIKEFFDSRSDLHFHRPNNPNVIKINHPWKHLQTLLDPILSQYFKTNKGQGGNIYKHSNVYATHVDSGEPYQLINALIPIYLPEPDVKQHFVVFDQWIENGIGRTWNANHVVKHNLDYNTITSSIPYNDIAVYDKIDADIDREFYNSYLDSSDYHYEHFKGLTGTAYEFRPGNLILFNSNNLHCTGKLTTPWKLGLHINFEGSLEELLHE